MRISRRKPPDWTDPNQSDPGIVLLELFAFLGENLLDSARPRHRRRLAFAALLLIALWKVRADRAE